MLQQISQQKKQNGIIKPSINPKESRKIGKKKRKKRCD